MLQNGLYEKVISKGLEEELARSEQLAQTASIDEAEASKVLSKYIAGVTEQHLRQLQDHGGSLKDQIELTNRIIQTIVQNKAEEENPDSVAERAEQLLAVFGRQNQIQAVNRKAEIIRPETSIAQTSLFTGAVHEPQMFSELKKEIVSCSRIDMLVSFIKWSGLRLIINELAEFARNGGRLRVITTSYMGATDVKAVEELRKLPGAEIKVSYDTKRTRLHAKTYVFYRDTGFTTAYVGSSNLSNAAISSGLEWNVKVTRADLPETIDKIAATFESYWNSSEFETYTEEKQTYLAKALRAEKYFDTNNPELYTLDIQPYSYQREILDRLDAERRVRGHMRNLVVAATGTGKTVIAALDYKRFRKAHAGAPCRLLFVAHREEILKQSLYTFRAVLKDANFGDLFVGGSRPDSIDALFISIQTFHSQDFAEKTSADFYDYLVVDEFHHAAAPTYQKLLEYYQPEILLGLTATPERMDGKNILKYFDNRIAAEIRLPEAIDRKLLCPFQYFGVTDTVDLDTLKWSAGGYDKGELTKVYTFSGMVAEKRAGMIVASLLRYVTDIDLVKGLGFCVSVQHAEFMSRFFNEKGIPSIYLTGGSAEEERKSAKNKLVSGEVRFIFVVDIYNEGVDIPEVNTVLFLRPTESLTVFLQQLGRGLRLAEGKECLTVLDFIGQANKKYHFEDKFAALLSNTTRGVSREIKDGFVSAPKGCYIQLERKAEKYILDNIRASYGSSAGLIMRIASFEEDAGKPLSFAAFLAYNHLDPRSLYKYASFSRLCVRADVRKDFREDLEEIMTKALLRFSVLDSRRLIGFLLEILPRLDDVDFSRFSALEKRMLQMFYVTVWGKTIEDWNGDEMRGHLHALSDSPVMLQELMDLLQYQYERIDFIDEAVDLGFDCPLDLHCTYTRDQLLAALDFMKPSTVREGVKWLPDKKLDVFFVTLNKSDKDYSPTTMYQDYSINENLFHWQSQSTTSERSATAQRYIHHKEMGTRVLLFVREFKKDRISGGAEAYTYLGTANYVKHEGEKPMNITWRLDAPIPAKYIRKTGKLMVS
ncbi:MAG: DUF3427 domain-containing protein [Eubacterium sp.]|nr:DUF3427 domain-containing protein [Eubacterium sp.]